MWFRGMETRTANAPRRVSCVRWDESNVRDSPKPAAKGPKRRQQQPHTLVIGFPPTVYCSPYPMGKRHNPRGMQQQGTLTDTTGKG